MKYSIIIDGYIDHINSKSLREKTEEEDGKFKTKVGFSMDKLPLPTFEGNIRSCHRFKKEFHELILPNVSGFEAAFTLRQCLKGPANEYLSVCEDDVSGMFDKLDTKFGDHGRIMDVVISEIKNYPKIKEKDSTTVIFFVNKIEKAERDLSKLKLQAVISLHCFCD